MALADLNKGFVDLILAALNNGIDAVRDSTEPMSPFVVVESGPGDRKFQRFAGNHIEQCIEQAMEFARDTDAMSRVVVAYGGTATVDGSTSDAVLVVGRERGASATVLVAQRYAPKKFMKKFQTIGEPELVGPGPSL